MSIEIVMIDANNISTNGFFCYRCKPNLPGYKEKENWLLKRFDEGLRLLMAYEKGKPVGFIEYMPAELAWRAVYAENYMMIHCICALGKTRADRVGSRLLRSCMADAQKQGMNGVATVAGDAPWLARTDLFKKHGFRVADRAQGTFYLMTRAFNNEPLPVFPQDWNARMAQCGDGLTISYAAQCPYHNDAVRFMQQTAEGLGIPSRSVRYETAAELRDNAPSPYGIFNVVYDGHLLSHCYLSESQLVERIHDISNHHRISA